MSSVKATMAARPSSARPRGLRALNWPLRDYPPVAIATLACCCLLAVVAGWLSQSVSMGLLSALALASAVWKMWVPITTEFGPRGITLSFLGLRRRIAWRDISCMELGSGGLFVSSQPEHAAPAAQRTLFLPWGREREAIASFCEEYRITGGQ